MGIMDKAKDAAATTGVDKAQEKFVNNDKVNEGIDKAQEKFAPKGDDANNEEQ
ncbi:hypothetical protein [Corynebacterium tapiri]|uniref:hypothetical protein n=1 Tax=Corynebacterium tapiri TaxID=1448266 RepID=UPI0015D58ABD|nr:hypothetical protein [Corynebacterium tapiri]